MFVVGGTSFNPNNNNDHRWQNWNGSTPLVGVDSGSNGGACVSIYAPASEFLLAGTGSTTAYLRASGTSFSAPLTAAVALRYMEKNNINPTSASQVYGIYNYLLDTARNTGTTLYDVTTPESWMCSTPDSSTGYPYTIYTIEPDDCPNNTGLNGTSEPIHFASVGNTSNANILYSNLHIGDSSCP
jgi:hypothetical protein